MTILPYFNTPDTTWEVTSTAQMSSTYLKEAGVSTTAVKPGAVDAEDNQGTDHCSIEQVAGDLDVMLHIAFVSLAVLCAVCVAVCMIMVALFFIVCKRRSDGVLRQRYNKVPLTDRADKKGSIEIKEESFVTP